MSRKKSNVPYSTQEGESYDELVSRFASNGPGLMNFGGGVQGSQQQREHVKGNAQSNHQQFEQELFQHAGIDFDPRWTNEAAAGNQNPFGFGLSLSPSGATGRNASMNTSLPYQGQAGGHPDSPLAAAPGDQWYNFLPVAPTSSGLMPPPGGFAPDNFGVSQEQGNEGYDNPLDFEALLYNPDAEDHFSGIGQLNQGNIPPMMDKAISQSQNRNGHTSVQQVPQQYFSQSFPPPASQGYSGMSSVTSSTPRTGQEGPCYPMQNSQGYPPNHQGYNPMQGVAPSPMMQYPVTLPLGYPGNQNPNQGFVMHQMDYPHGSHPIPQNLHYSGKVPPDYSIQPDASTSSRGSRRDQGKYAFSPSQNPQPTPQQYEFQEPKQHYNQRTQQRKNLYSNQEIPASLNTTQRKKSTNASQQDKANNKSFKSNVSGKSRNTKQSHNKGEKFRQDNRKNITVDIKSPVLTPHDAAEAEANRKRAELNESPSTRIKFKEFYRTFRAKEKENFDAAIDFAMSSLETLPEKIKWRVYLEMADLAKRENKFSLARSLYKEVNTLQPYAPQGWLEYSKMEEECGQLPHCQEILHEGLKYCSFSESLLTKAIKHEERMGNLEQARALLARLRSQSVEKAWRTILEGALLEARAGHKIIARKVFKYLMKNVPWYGPIYHEAARFEERNEDYERAIDIVEKGLRSIPRYGPLWFNTFRLYEKMEVEDAMKQVKQLKPLIFWNEGVEVDIHHLFGIAGDELGNVLPVCELKKTHDALQRAMGNISKELVWKVHFEAAQVAERGGGDGWLERSRHAYVQSILRCPLNLRWKVWLSGARTELVAGNVEIARQLLVRALDKVPDKSRSQVLLECSRLEEYTGQLDVARKVLANAREETRHEWKVFLESVMLEVRAGNRMKAIEVAEEALKIHSGTGRLWAILVQLKHAHGPDAQRQVFRDALKQVPKSGEVWCEGARVRMHPMSSHFDLKTAYRFLRFAIQFTPQYGDSFIEALRLCLLLCDDENITSPEQAREAMLNADTSALEQRCVNADPNYGALWFHCKRGPFDTARQVLRVAKQLLIAELIHFRDIYRKARGLPPGKTTKTENYTPSDPRIMELSSSNPAHWLSDRFECLPEYNKNCFDFSTGLVNVNWFRERVYLLTDRERRKLLFGSDQIVP